MAQICIPSLIRILKPGMVVLSFILLPLGVMTEGFAQLTPYYFHEGREPPETPEPALDSFSGEPIDSFPGWRASPWYLNYNVDFWPWIYHDEHGWQFVDSGSIEAVIFVWDFGLGQWLFLNENTYRWMFLFGDNSGWIFTFDDNTPGRRFFQRFDNGSLFSIPAGLTVE